MTYTNNTEGKITECWLVKEESIFFLIVLREKGKITRSRLVLRLPSNSLCSREVVFSGTMASRFEMVDEEYNENEKTKDSTEWWENVFKKWANERNM